MSPSANMLLKSAFLLLAVPLIMLSMFPITRAKLITGSRTGLIDGTADIEWTIDEGKQVMRVAGRAATSGWVGVGFAVSYEARMAHAALVVMTGDDGDHKASIAGYFGKDRNTSPEGPLTGQINAKLLRATVNSETSVTDFEFERSLKALDATHDYDIRDGPTQIIMAYSKDDSKTFGFHGKNYDSITVSLWDPEAIESLPEPSESIVVNQRGYQSSGSILDGNYKFNWWLDVKEKQIMIQILAATKGWLALALAPQKDNMAGADIIAGTASGKLQTYHATKNSSPDPTNKYATLVASHYNEVEKMSSLTFMRPLSDGGAVGREGDFIAIENGTQSVLLAFSKDDNDLINYHGSNRIGFEINLFDGNPVPPVDESFNWRPILLYSHGILLTLAWAFLGSIGIGLARFTKNLMPIWWMRFHIIVLVGTLVLSIAGFLCIFAYADWSFNLSDPHTILGFVILLTMLGQPILGFIADRMFKPDRKSPPIFPDQIHWWIGRMLWIGGLFNVYLGLERANAHAAIKVLYYVWVLLLIAVFVFNEKPADTHVQHQRVEENYETVEGDTPETQRLINVNDVRDDGYEN